MCASVRMIVSFLTNKDSYCACAHILLCFDLLCKYSGWSEQLTDWLSITDRYSSVLSELRMLKSSSRISRNTVLTWKFSSTARSLYINARSDLIAPTPPAPVQRLIITIYNHYNLHRGRRAAFSYNQWTRDKKNIVTRWQSQKRQMSIRIGILTAEAVVQSGKTTDLNVPPVKECSILAF